MKTKQIDYYGNEDNYIHLKFGEVRKMYNFTPDFTEKYPAFAKEYANYWEGKTSKFKNPFQIVRYVDENKLPVSFYYNFTDEPAGDTKEIMDYLVREVSYLTEKI